MQITVVNVPGAADSVAWESVCQRRESWLMIRHAPFRYTSRHVTKERKRPYMVTLVGPRGMWHDRRGFATLEEARVYARREALPLARALAGTDLQANQ